MGLAPTAAPIPVLLALDSQIAHARRVLNPAPPVEGPAPVPAGRRRVRLTTGYLDRTRGAGQYFIKGDVVDLSDEDTRELLLVGGAVEVGA